MCKGNFLASFEFPQKVNNEEESTRSTDKTWRAQLVTGPGSPADHSLPWFLLSNP